MIHKAILFGCLLPSLYSAFTDASKRILYDFITVPILIMGIAYSIYIQSYGNLITAAVVFLCFFLMALKGGIAGGDVKFVTAISVWFGYPLSLYLIELAAILAFIFGSYKLIKIGLFKQRMLSFFRGAYLRLFFKTAAIPANKLPESNDIYDEAIPFGTFLVIAAWIIYYFKLSLST